MRILVYQLIGNVIICFGCFKYRMCPIRIKIIHGGLNIYGFYHGLALDVDTLPLAIARGKIFGIKGQPVVKSVYIQAPMNYFLSGKNGLFVWVYSVMGLRLVLLCLTPLSTIFQLHRGVNLIGGRKTTDLSQVIGKLYYIMFYLVHLAIMV